MGDLEVDLDLVLEEMTQMDQILTECQASTLDLAILPEDPTEEDSLKTELKSETFKKLLEKLLDLQEEQ